MKIMIITYVLDFQTGGFLNYLRKAYGKTAPPAFSQFNEFKGEDTVANCHL